MGLGDSLGQIRNLFSNYGNMAPNPDAASTKPPVDEAPIGASGRVHFNGFIQIDEYKTEWVGTKGLELADRMWRSDADIKRDTLATWSPITSATWTVEPYGGDEATDQDRRAAELCQHALFEYMSPNIMIHLAEVGPILIRSGFVDFEQIWKSTTYKGKKVILPKKLDLRLPRTIWKWYQDDDGELTGIVQFLPNAANVYIPATELIHYRLQAEGDNWVGTSMYRHAWKHYYYKEKLELIDAIGQERKAVGVPVVYPPTGASDETKQELETVLANLHVNEVGYVMMPGPKARTDVDESVGWEMEIKTFDSSSSNGIRESIDQQTLKVAGAFIADFLELGHHQVGARATADVQEDPFMTAVKALAELIVQPLNALCARIATLNVPGIEGTPKLTMSLHDEASLSELSTYAQQLFMAELLTADGPLEDYFRNRAGFPAADKETREETEKAKKAGRERAINGGAEQDGADATAAAETGEKFNQPGKGAKIKPGPVKPGKSAEPRGPNDPDREAAPGKASDTSQTRGPNKPAKGTLNLDNGDLAAPWWEKLLSQGRIREALDAARADMETATRPAAVKAASTIAARARSGSQIEIAQIPQDLVAAFEQEMRRLYELGYQTVVDEVAKQHLAMGRQPTAIALDDGEGEEEATDEAASVPVKGRRRLKRRSQIAAEHVTNEVARETERAVLAGERSPLALQRRAETAAQNAIRKEALTNAAPSINDGRRDAALVTAAVLAAKAVANPEAPAATGKTEAVAPQQLKGIYTSVLDNRTCDYCESADDGVERDLDDPALEVPNPECSGGEFCRCTVVFVLSGASEALNE